MTAIWGLGFPNPRLGWQRAVSGATGKVWGCCKDPDVWLKGAKTLQAPRQTLHHKPQAHRGYSPFSGRSARIRSRLPGSGQVGPRPALHRHVLCPHPTLGRSSFCRFLGESKASGHQPPFSSALERKGSDGGNQSWAWAPHQSSRGPRPRAGRSRRSALGRQGSFKNQGQVRLLGNMSKGEEFINKIPSS